MSKLGRRSRISDGLLEGCQGDALVGEGRLQGLIRFCRDGGLGGCHRLLSRGDRLLGRLESVKSSLLGSSARDRIRILQSRLGLGLSVQGLQLGLVQYLLIVGGNGGFRHSPCLQFRNGGGQRIHLQLKRGDHRLQRQDHVLQGGENGLTLQHGTLLKADLSLECSGVGVGIRRLGGKQFRPSSGQGCFRLSHIHFRLELQCSQIGQGGCGIGEPGLRQTLSENRFGQDVDQRARL
ncbi:MAG: hypothetical protein VKK98_05985 [Cyanobacteriota bacterium]|nr:hypothetical protein [Cyanobacteriota bacterium]